MRLSIAVITLLIMSILLIADHNEASAQSNVTWTATLSAEQDSGDEYGYEEGVMGSMTDGTFDYGGRTYTIDYIKWDDSAEEVEFRMLECLKASEFVSLRISSRTFSNPDRVSDDDAGCESRRTRNQEFEFDTSSNPLRDGQSYTITLTLRGSGGVTMTPTATLSAPAAPTGLHRTGNGPMSVNIAWDSVPGASKYAVQYKRDGANSWISASDNISGASYKISGLTCGTDYDFTVKSFGDGTNALAQWSSPSGTLAANPESFQMNHFRALQTPLKGYSTIVEWDTRRLPKGFMFQLAGHQSRCDGWRKKKPLYTRYEWIRRPRRRPIMKLLSTSAFIGRRVPEAWRSAFLSVMLLAAIIVGALYVEVAHAQGVDGAITGLTLTSDAPGTLTVSWNAASPTPTDYRIDWAKSDQDYQSWKVDEGHKYPDPSATTATIADLDHDTEYKIRMRARYYRGEHEGNSLGGPWATATITVAGEPAETPTPEPVEEEPTPERGTIETLAATDDDDGQLVLSWPAPAAPNATPTDYDVNWAKSSEDYPADTAEAGNAHPDSTTHTQTDLDYDTDYKVRVRARYTDGENADSPWNGPWTETTAQVKQPLPAAPSFINTALTEGQVLLSWLNPSDDSITGYQILRGPDAASLVVIEEDTGSTSTSYTDEAPPAGQTHHYGVKARNSAGLSPAGTATATVPAAEVLITAPHESVSDTLVSNLGQTASDAAFAGPLLSSIVEQGISFTTGDNALGYHPTGVQLYLIQQGSDTPTPQVSIRGDNAGVPGETALYDLNTSTAITNVYQLITFTRTDEVTLQPNTTYWLYVNATGGTVGIQDTASNNEDTGSQAGWSIGDDRLSRSDGGDWTAATANYSLRMKILGHGISPDPSDGPPPEDMESVSEPADGDVADNTTTIGRLAVNGSVTGRHHEAILNVEPPIYDVDWFAFTVEANTNYQFTANPGERHPRLYILRIFNDEGTELRNSLIKPDYDAQGDPLFNGVDRLNNIAFRTHTAGTSYVSIESLHGNGSAVAYTLDMFGDDYSNDITTTATVTVDGSGRNFEDFQNYLMRTDRNADSSRTDDVDWIRVALKANVTYEIVYDVACLHQGRIEGIYDSTGTLLPGTTLEWPRKTKGWCTDLTTEFTPSSDSDHYIAVSAQGSHFKTGSVNPFQGVQGTLTITAK